MSNQEPPQRAPGLDPMYEPTEDEFGFFTDADDTSDSASFEPLRRQTPELFGDEEDGYVTTLRQLKIDLQIPDDVTVAYPGSATHVGVARVFGKDKVVHVDPDEVSCDLLAEHGYNAAAIGIEDFRPEETLDGIVALNSYGEPTSEMLTRVLKPGGFIIANNYTHWAHEIAQLPGIKLVSAVLPAYGHEDARIYRGEEIPEDATGLFMLYMKIGDGRVSQGTPEDHNFAEEDPKYPDALFVFKYE